MHLIYTSYTFVCRFLCCIHLIWFKINVCNVYQIPGIERERERERERKRERGEREGERERGRERENVVI